MRKNLLLKMKESLTAVLPITMIMLVLNFTIAPLGGSTVVMFLVGAVLLIFGMGLFTLGADMAMMPMGTNIGSELTKSRKLGKLIVVSLLVGVMITIAEPDLQVLASQVPSIDSWVLILSVSAGVGVFLMIAMLRVVFNLSLNWLFVGFYTLIFILGIFVSQDYLAIAFDSGGVTTGPITVPFIMALGIGVASVSKGKDAQDNSFGLVGLCSVGPIVAVMILGIFYKGGDIATTTTEITAITSVMDVLRAFGQGIVHYAGEVGLALSPIVVFFIIYQLIYLHLPKRQLLRLAVGVAYTFVGLVLFLSGVNVGFMPAGYLLGEVLGALSYNWILIPLAMVIGFFIVSAEPAVHVLNDQVEEITGGSISKRAMMGALSIGMAVSLALAMTRVLTGLSIWWYLIPGYGIALGLSFVVPKIFTAIAFDSGGVASGPMTATFLLPFAMGACAAVGGNPLTDAFGVVAMVAMTPLITIQVMGVIYKIKLKRAESLEALAEDAQTGSDDEIIDFEG